MSSPFILRFIDGRGGAELVEIRGARPGDAEELACIAAFLAGDRGAVRVEVGMWAPLPSPAPTLTPRRLSLVGGFELGASLHSGELGEAYRAVAEVLRAGTDARPAARRLLEAKLRNSEEPGQRAVLTRLLEGL